MNEAGIARAVLVPPSWQGYSNDFALSAHKEYPDRFVVMGRLRPEAVHSAGSLSGWKSTPGMYGLRFGFNNPPLQQLITSGVLDWLWLEAERNQIPICLLASHSIMKLIDRLAERYPSLKLVMDHCGLVQGKDDIAFREFNELLALARRPNIAVKVSCLPFFTDDAYPFKSLHPYLRKVFDSFGPSRLFWGTDLTRLPCTYKEVVRLFTEELSWLSGEDLQLVMGKAICNWIGWKI